MKLYVGAGFFDEGLDDSPIEVVPMLSAKWCVEFEALVGGPVGVISISLADFVLILFLASVASATGVDDTC